MNTIVDARGVSYVPPAVTGKFLNWRSLLIWAVLLTQCGLIGRQILRERHAQSPSVISESQMVVSFGAHGYYADTPLKDAGPQNQRSLDRALMAWRGELPKSVKLTRPRLLEGTPVTCESHDAIACADLRNYQIVIAARKCDCDMDTILMHEVGHLLGVPHIEADPLMNPSYSGKLERPSEQAVALALVHRRDR